jgi:hypothetical protein
MKWEKCYDAECKVYKDFVVVKAKMVYDKNLIIPN